MNLRPPKKDFDRLGVPAEVRLRHGIVVHQVFAEAGAGDLRSDRHRHVACARHIGSLHHGRSHADHFESCELPGTGRSLG